MTEQKTFELPPFQLSTRCSLCNLWNTNRDLFHQLTEMIICGTQARILREFLYERGVRVHDTTIYVHKNKHVYPDLQRALQVENQVRAMGRMAGALAPLDSAQFLLRTLVAKLMPVVENLSVTNLGELKDPKIEKVISKCSQLAQALSFSQKCAADIAVKQQQLFIQRISAAKARGELIDAALDYLEATLEKRPDLIEAVREALKGVADKP